jgi:hypothetical protein
VTTKTAGGLVNTVFPTFGWTHGDPDADAMSAYQHHGQSRVSPELRPELPCRQP